MEDKPPPKNVDDLKKMKDDLKIMEEDLKKKWKTTSITIL